MFAGFRGNNALLISHSIESANVAWISNYVLENFDCAICIFEESINRLFLDVSAAQSTRGSHLSWSWLAYKFIGFDSHSTEVVTPWGFQHVHTQLPRKKKKLCLKLCFTVLRKLYTNFLYLQRTKFCEWRSQHLFQLELKLFENSLFLPPFQSLRGHFPKI